MSLMGRWLVGAASICAEATGSFSPGPSLPVPSPKLMCMAYFFVTKVIYAHCGKFGKYRPLPHPLQSAPLTPSCSVTLSTSISDCDQFLGHQMSLSKFVLLALLRSSGLLEPSLPSFLWAPEDVSSWSSPRGRGSSPGPCLSLPPCSGVKDMSPGPTEEGSASSLSRGIFPTKGSLPLPF